MSISALRKSFARTSTHSRQSHLAALLAFAALALALAAVPGRPGCDRVVKSGAFVASPDVVADNPTPCGDTCATDRAGAAESVHTEAEEDRANRQRDEREEPFAFHVLCDACVGGLGCEWVG